jgi:hypothetical protein
MKFETFVHWPTKTGNNDQREVKTTAISGDILMCTLSCKHADQPESMDCGQQSVISLNILTN